MSIDLGLDRLAQLVQHLPPYTRPTVHIAGTNGKGSVAAFVHSILSNGEPPLLVGRFNSPHLVSVEDCIVVGNHPVTKEVYLSARARVEEANKKHNAGLSSFELLTLTALQIFEEARLDLVVVEVGLGGRLDATNIIPTSAILVSALTAVDLDHQAFLGDTVEKIAKEKVGIAREGRPFVLGPQKHGSVVDVVRQELERTSAQLITATSVVADFAPDPLANSTSAVAPRAFSPPAPRRVIFNVESFPEQQISADIFLPGDHQLDNLGIAVTITSCLLSHPSSIQQVLSNRLTAQHIARGISATRWPGRLSFHRIPPTSSSDTQDGLSLSRPLLVLADGAHNAASATTLSSYVTDFISQTIPPTCQDQAAITLTFILGLSHSPPKTPQQTLSPLLPLRISPNIKLNIKVACVPFSPVDGMPWVRPVPPSELTRTVKELTPDAEVVVFEAEATSDERESSAQNKPLVQAINWAGNRNPSSETIRDLELVVIAGSLYLVADLYRLLGTNT